MRFLHCLTHLAAFASQPLTFIQQMHATQGDYFQTRLAHKKFHFTRDPDHVATVLGQGARSFQKARVIFSKIEPVTGPRGLVQLEGERWQTLRRETDTIFRSPAMDSYPRMIDRYLGEMCAKLAVHAETGAPADLFALMMEYTLQTAAHVIFSAPDPALLARILEAFVTLNRLCGKRMRGLFVLPLSIPVQANRKIRHCQRVIREAVNQLLAQALADSSSAGKSGLQALLLERYPEDPALILDQLLTFLFAGYETTATSLACCFYLLSCHPAAQDRLAATVFAEKIPSLAETRQCVFATAVYREALRLYPPAWILAREATENVWLGEERIAKGETLIISLRELHRREANWDMPDAFRPERFLEGCERHAFAFIPFGAGRRICSGHQFAMLEAVTALVTLCQQFSFSPVSDVPLQMAAMITFHPAAPVRLRVRHR